MKFSLSWLKQHLDTDADAQTIADKLTAIGLEVEGVENPAEALAPFRVAKVLTAEKHPQADKLQVLTVDAGEGAVQVVCGAPNARAGMLGVFGPPGAYVPGSDLTLKVAAIRGVESRGMMCSVRELQIGEEHDGIIELAGDAPGGRGIRRFCRPQRSRLRRERHAEPPGLHGRARNCPRPCRRRRRNAEAARNPADRGQLQVADRHPHRGRGRLPCFLRTSDPGHPQRAQPRVASAPPEERRAAPDLGGRRPHQLSSCSTSAARRTPMTSPSWTER